MTLLILVVTCVYSVLHFHLSDKISSEHLNAPAAVERQQKQKLLALAACPLSDLSTAECGVLRATVQSNSSSGRSESAFGFVSRLEAESKRIKDQKVRLGKLAEFALRASAFREASSEIKALVEFSAFAEALEREEQLLVSAAQGDGLLTRSTYSWLTVLKAQFLHDGWMHLIGNMIFFLLFAIPLEQRIGPLALGLVYFLGGSTGLTLELFMSSEPVRPLLGASANVSAVGAAFMVAFWAFSVRVWVSMFFVFNQIVLIPTWLFFAVFVVMQDVNGALNIQGGNVAHLAHLGGFGIGILLGAIAAQAQWLSKPFAFPFEGELFLASRKITDPEVKLSLLREVLFHNPANTTAMVESWTIVKRLGVLNWERLPAGGKVFLNEKFCELLYFFNKSDKKALGSVLSAARVFDWPGASLIAEREITKVMGLIRALERAEKFNEALELLRILRKAHPGRGETESLAFTERRLATNVAAKAQGQVDGEFGSEQSRAANRAG